MEAAAAARGVSLPMPPPSQPTARKEWRAVTEPSGRSSGNEGREPADVDFCSVTIEGSLDNDILQQRLHNVVKQREELQQIETDLRAQLIARAEIIEMRNTYDAQNKEHANANIQLQEKMREKEQRMLELERMIDEKDRELHAIRLDTEAVWAKEDLLREQSKELQSYRRERDNIEAERAQHIKQIHDLQEHCQEKEQQLLETQEQNRIAQEALIFKDEQLREAQSWITRVQEFDVSVHAELRDRVDQYGQLWNVYTRQCAEMERLQFVAHQLHQELTEAKERNTYSDKSHVAQTNPNDVSEHGQGNGGQLEVSGGSSNDGSSGLPNGNGDNASFVSGGNASIQADHAHGVPIAPNNLLGIPTYLHGQVPALHPFVMHQQGVQHSLPAHMGQFHSMPAISSLQQWQNQQALSDGQHMATHDHPPLQPESTMLRSETSYDYASSVNGQVLHSDYVNSSQMEAHSAVSASNMEEQQALESIDKSYAPEAHTQQSLQQISSQFHEALRLDSLEHNNDLQEQNVNSLSNPAIEAQGLTSEKSASISHVSSPAEANNTAQFSESASDSASDVIVPESISEASQKNTGVVGNSLEDNLLDERSLLACIVRTIPPGSGGKIRISSTLPNRLGKMIAPMHWHDYKRKYGKLDEFVSNHPDLFVIDGDFIQLREGAQEIIAATAAVAKVAAAAAAGSSSHSSLLPSVAVTPMAQTHRVKRAPSNESASGNSSQLMQNQRPNGASAVKILSKSKDHPEMNGRDGNGTNSGKNNYGSSQNKGSTHWKPNVNVVGKQPSRGIDVAANPRR